MRGSNARPRLFAFAIFMLAIAAAGAVLITIPSGATPLSSVTITGQVFKDFNGNATKEAGDSGLVGWTIFIDVNNNGVLDNGDISTTTDALGNYGFAFSAPPTGSVTVKLREVTQGGWLQTTNNPADITITSAGGTFSGRDFGNFQRISISGQVFNDLNGDGTLGAGDPGIPGRTIFLDTNGNNVLDNGESSQITSVTGTYSFTNLGPGTYRVREVIPAGSVRTSANPVDVAASSGFNVDGAINPGLNFGNFQLITISGKVFEDFNNNGLIDAGEPGLAGRTVFIDANQNQVLDAGEIFTTTDANGNYSISNLGPGSYWLTTLRPAGWNFAGIIGVSAGGLSGATPTINFGSLPKFLVTNTNAGGSGSLDQAVRDANATAGANVLNITFSIPSSGVQSIALTTPLPAITHPVSIDGTTQPGYAGSPVIELNGFNAGIDTSGLTISAGNSTVKGLVINRFGRFGVVLDTKGGDVIAGNYIGTDVSGTSALGNRVGIWIIGVTGNTIGGATVAERNVISGNTSFGVQIGDDASQAPPTTGNRVEGNYLGTNASGTGALPNGNSGIYLALSASNNTVGGTDAGAGNLISGNPMGVFINGNDNFVQGNLVGTDKNGTARLPNTANGILIGGAGNLIGGTTSAARNVISGNNRGVFISLSTATSNKVQGNYIGTDITGAAALGNSLNGVALAGTNNVVGGTVAGAGNVISDNLRGGVSILGQGTTGNLLQGNFIGTKADGISPLGNHDSGVTIGTFASNNTVGGTQPAAANIIAFNVNAGVFLDSRSGNPVGNAILSNSIFNNTALGIDLAPTGVTPNDPGDGDTGANNLQNFPQLSLANQNSSGTAVTGTLNSTPNTSFRIEFFLNQSCDPSGNGQGKLFVAASNVTTDTNGIAPINSSVALGFDTSGWFITSTATRLDAQGSPIETSEFSNCVRVPFADLAITGTASPNQVRSGDNLTYTLTLTNNGPDASTNVSVSDQLPSAVTLVSCTATGGGTCSNSTPGTVTVGFSSVASAAQTTITIIGKVGNAAGQLTDTATVLNTVFDPAQNNNSVTIKTDIATGTAVQFSQPTYVVGERGGSIAINVTRTGDTSVASSVDYATDDGSIPSIADPCATVTGKALERCDYTRATGTLQFAPNETQKTFTVLLNDDSYTEGTERVNLVLSNPVGAVLGIQPTATLLITDDVPESAGNPVDDSTFFVRQHYHDFLNREADTSGLDFWTNEIESCGTEAPCRDVKHVNVSGAFFLSIEFQETGYLVERMYKTAFGDAIGSSNFPTPHQLPVPVIRLQEFLRDTQHIGQGVVVGVGDWQNQLESNKQQFALEFVSRSRFTSAYPASLTADQFVSQLNANAGQALTAADIAQLEALFGGGAASSNNNPNRASVLRQVAESATLKAHESNNAFVLMQYFGYLRRNPNDAPDADYTGYDFWLQKLSQFNGNFVAAEMVKAFISSDEYRHRFGSQ